MQAALITIARLIPALAGGPIAATDSQAVPIPAIEAVHPVNAPMVGPLGVNLLPLAGEWNGAPSDTARTRKRTKAIEYRGFYHARLTLHRWLSFAMLPLFVGSYVTGDQVLKHSSSAPDWALKWHRPLATATAAVFAATTITGLWNLWDSRKDPAGRTKRYVHSLLFIAADAGFAYSGITLAREAKNSERKRIQHRNIALISMGISITSGGMMLFFK